MGPDSKSFNPKPGNPKPQALLNPKAFFINLKAFFINPKAFFINPKAFFNPIP